MSTRTVGSALVCMHGTVGGRSSVLFLPVVGCMSLGLVMCICSFRVITVLPKQNTPQPDLGRAPRERESTLALAARLENVRPCRLGHGHELLLVDTENGTA